MRIVDKIKILSTPYEDTIIYIYHLIRNMYQLGNKKKKWLEQLIGQDFTISDLLVLVGEKHYLRFYAALSKMGLIDSMKSRKINIFKISWDFNITLSEKIIYKNLIKFLKKSYLAFSHCHLFCNVLLFMFIGQIFLLISKTSQ